VQLDIGTGTYALRRAGNDFQLFGTSDIFDEAMMIREAYADKTESDYRRCTGGPLQAFRGHGRQVAACRAMTTGARTWQ